MQFVRKFSPNNITLPQLRYGVPYKTYNQLILPDLYHLCTESYICLNHFAYCTTNIHVYIVQQHGYKLLGTLNTLNNYSLIALCWSKGVLSALHLFRFV